MDVGGADRHILPRGAPRRRVQLGALLIGVAVATIALPSLVMGPDDDGPAATGPPPMALSAPAGTPTGPPTPPGSPTAPGPPTPAAASPGSGAATPTAGRPASRRDAGPNASGPTSRCAATAGGDDVVLTAGVSCGIYDVGFGNGWRATGHGLKLLPGWKVPETDEVALRVERTRPGLPQTEMALVAARPVRIDGDDVLRFRVWGGRDYGTVLRVSAGHGTVTVSARADRWTNYSVRLGQLTDAASLTRIDLVVAADEVPHVNRFYLDDIAIVG
ncbi:hypothetical protein [Micromonospora sp. NPDC002575]|uniref:hypothetical protein n=1 Tax=Micromonospora sp. NPDC002575 TaxID=3364222 RepID=UPI0036BF6BC0